MAQEDGLSKELMNEEHTEESVKSKRYNVRGLKGKNKGR